LHFADITNPCREWVVCQRWTDLVFREFFAQGDLERSMKLPISFLMDKRITNIAESQVNFINFIVEPALKEFGKLCRGVVSGAPG
jgi:3'5'-cyclic nucleotide phosphodiesterase